MSSSGLIDKLIDNPIEFWERRHARTDAWRSGGDRGLTIAENYEFYAFRLGRVIQLIRRTRGAERPIRILDAGCGRGYLTDSLRQCGHRVFGIDSSRSAIDRATETYGEHFECCPLSGHRPAALYDVVICMDVLFHILDDAEWKRSIAAMCRYASAEATLILTDAFGAERFTLGTYIVHRAADEYTEALAAHGFDRVDFEPYNFGANPNGFATFTRGF